MLLKKYNLIFFWIHNNEFYHLICDLSPQMPPIQVFLQCESPYKNDCAHSLRPKEGKISLFFAHACTHTQLHKIRVQNEVISCLWASPEGRWRSSTEWFRSKAKGGDHIFCGATGPPLSYNKSTRVPNLAKKEEKMKYSAIQIEKPWFYLFIFFARGGGMNKKLWMLICKRAWTIQVNQKKDKACKRFRNQAIWFPSTIALLKTNLYFMRV